MNSLVCVLTIVIVHSIIPLPDNKILDWSKFKPIADNI